MAGSRYLSDLGEDRERVAIERWCLGHFQELLAAVNLRRGWWFGLGLGRREIFGVGDGDVDIIAGPVELTLSPRDLREIAREQADRYRGLKPAYLRELVLRRAGQLGFVEWPPRVGFVAAIEAKASYFNGKIWKRKHDSKSEQRDLRRQIAILHEHRVNSVNFLHLASTTPAGEIGSSWRAAAERIDLANRSGGFPNAFDPDGRTGVFRAFMGAIPEGTEEMNGVHEGLTVISRALHTPIEEQPWHARLRMRLSDLPRPRYFRTTILRCAKPDCRRWRLADGPAADDYPCTCGRGAGSSDGRG